MNMITLNYVKNILYNQTFLYIASIYTQFKIVLYYIFKYANKQVLNNLNRLYHQRLNKIQSVLRRCIEIIVKHNVFKQSIIIKSII